ncbi:MAG: hypothetical protein ABSC06_10670 [Rhodopila sp.]
MIANLIADWLEEATLQAYQWLRHPLASMLEIETDSDDGNNLVSVRGDLATLIRLDGLRYLPTEADIKSTADGINIELKSLLGSPGRSIQFLFLAEPARTPLFMANHIASVRHFAEAENLNIEPLLQERQKLWSTRMCVEETYAALWTRRAVLNRGERSSEAAKAAKLRAALPHAMKTQKLWLSSSLLSAKHEAFIRSFRHALRHYGVGTTRLNPHDALKAMREVFDPGTYGSKWRARLQADLPSVRQPDADPKGDVSHFLNPPLADQMFRTEAHHKGLSQVDMGPNRFSPIDMTLAPQLILSFASLYDGLRRPAIPCRISFLLDSGGGRWTTARLQIASILAVFSPINKQVAAALELLKHRREAGDSIVRFRCSAATWGPSSNPDLVHQRAAKLESAIEGWGACQTSSVAGDPVQGMMSSALGLHANSTAPAADAPLTDVLRMMPWTRQGSPWESGSLLYMTPEGRPYPYDPTGSKRTSVVKLFVGGPGTGKSMLLNTMNLGLILSAAAVTGDQPNLPFIRIADIGYGGKGTIDLLHEALPPDSAHFALYVRFQNAPKFAYNIFGTQPGCRYPLPHERESIINIIATKMTPEGGRPYQSMSGLIAAAVDEVYRFRSDDHGNGEPRMYQRFVEPEVDEALTMHQIKFAAERPTWWDVTDALHAAGETRLMTIAQNHAMPLLDDLVTAAHVANVSDLYQQPRAPETTETMVQLFIRLVMEMIKDLPFLSQPTRFDLGEARVVVLDMEEMCRMGGARTTAQTQIMYLVATHILGRDFFLNEQHLQHIPENYRAYNLPRIQQFSTTVKMLGFDEMHFTRGCPQVLDQIELYERTGRKKAFHMALASQNLDDYPPQIADLASEIYITGLNSKGDTVEKAVAKFGLTAASGEIIRTRLSGPHQLDEGDNIYGAPFLAIWRLDDDGRQVEQMLYNLIGPIETWALSTRPDDVHLRDRLYRALGHRETWRRLSKVFPAGTARDEIDNRAKVLAEKGRNKFDAKEAVIGSLVAEIVDGMGVAIDLRPAGDMTPGAELERRHRGKILSWLDQL